MAPPASATEERAEHAWLTCGLSPFAGKYTVERVLGQGGMGTVFEARHVRLGQRVAIKVLGSGLREYPELVQRFEREARAAGSLTSAHAVRVFDIDATEDGTPYIVMELLAGRDLSSVVERDGPQPVARAVGWIVEACDAIDEAHRLGIIHRDIKPSNLFLADDGYRTLVKVLDFGIAKRVSACEASITQAVAPLGTPHYMSPEQVRCAKDVDARTDVWSLGVTLYELLCGRPPFPHESSSACIAAIAADPVPDVRTFRPELDDALASVVMKALAKNADDRYQSVAELVVALAPFVDADEDVKSRPTAPAPSMSSIPIVLELRPPSRSRNATAETVSATRVSRVRTAFGVASAAVLGFAVLVATPKCVSTGNDATASTIASPPNVAPSVLPQAPAPPPAPVAPAVEPTPEPVASAPAPVVRAPVHAAAPPKRPLVQLLVPAEKAHAPTSVAARTSSAHGGISGPGF